MKIVLTILIFLAVVIAATLLVPTRFELRWEIIINKPKNIVWDYVKIIGNQTKYSVRVIADPAIKLTNSWTDGTVGFIQSRDSTMQDVGKWAQEIKTIDEGTSYEVEITFEKPMVATNHAKTTLEDLWTTGTKVSTVFRWTNPRPSNLMSMLFLPKVQQDMNLKNLKEQIEK
jgi:hypothetical protein